MSDELKMGLLRNLMFGDYIDDHEHNSEIMQLYDFGLVELYGDKKNFAATNENGMIELARLVKLYFVFLN